MTVRHAFGQYLDAERYAKSLEYEELKHYTSNFSKDNYICKFQHGTVFRGKDGGQEVIVKIWDGNHMYQSDKEDRYLMFQEDIFLLNSDEFKGHPNLMKAIGFCDRPRYPVAIVYDFKPLDTVHNLISRGSFLWHHRIKVALGLASLLNSFHSLMPDPFLVRNIDASHIMCDHDYTPKLYDFSTISGGFYELKRSDGLTGCHGYMDPVYFHTAAYYSTCDVFAYGIVLLGLICKRVFNAETDANKEFVDKWAQREYTKAKLHQRWPSLVHQSLKSEQYFYRRDGGRITQLAMQCITNRSGERPDMEDVVSTLRSLRIVRYHGDDIDVHNMLQVL